VSQGISGLKKSIFAGVFVGALIAIMRYGVYHSIDMTNLTPETFTTMTLLGVALDLFVVLAGLLCGYIIAATAKSEQSSRSVFRGALIAGLVAGLINFLAMALIYYPQVPERWNYDVLNIVLYGVWYFVLIVVLSLAGGAIFTALSRKGRRVTSGRWLTSVEVGVAAAVVVALAYYAQSLAMETYQGMTINGSYDTLITQFIIDAFVLIVGVVAGLVTAILVRRSVSSPADFVLKAALAGLITGFIGLLVNMLLSLGAPDHLDLSGLTGLDWLNIVLQIINGAIMLMTMAIGGGVIYALLQGETNLLSTGPEEPEKGP
jgi:hypothetical protein